MFVVLLASLLVASSAEERVCYGRYNYSANLKSPRHYYKCSGPDTTATLEECKPDALGNPRIYDRKSGLCVAATETPDGRLVKRSAGGKEIKVLEREALGETVTVGTFYDARKSQVSNGASFWTKDQLATEVQNVSTVYSNVDVFMENNINERTYALDVSASLKLEFLGGLISVSGSAHYLRDETSSSDVARVTMNYKSTKKTSILPMKTPITHTRMCDIISDRFGPTHVITSVTYGLRSYLLFERDVRKTEYREEIGGSLSIAVNTIPSFSVAGSAAVDVNGNNLENIENLRVKFYGDVIISNMPATYNQTVYVFDQVNTAAKEKETPISFQLTPISAFCDGTEATINEISEFLTAKVTDILTELADLKKRVKTLLGRDPAIRFTSIKSQLLTFQAGLSEFTTQMTSKVANVLPALKSGEASEAELEALLGTYFGSVYNKDKADIFLDHRSREIRTIELVTDEAKKYPQEVTLSDIGAATDNRCIFNSKYAIVYQLYVLPAVDVAKLYRDGQYDQNTEANQWHNDLAKVGAAGSHLKKFLELARLNHGSDHCFLIRLDKINSAKRDTEKDAVIRMYRNGRRFEGDFAPPVAPPAPICTTSLYSGFHLQGVRNTESTSHVTAIKVTATWKQLVEKKEEATEETTDEETDEETEEEEKMEWEYFPTEEIVANADTFTINNLKPNTTFQVYYQYRIGQEIGYSVPSAPIECKTAATSAPILPSVTGHTSNTVTLQWSAPQQMVVSESEIEYVVSAVLDGEVKSQMRTNELTATLNHLEQGTYYKFTIQPFYKGVGSERVGLAFSTIPYPPDVPLLEGKDHSHMVLIVYTDRMVLPAGMTKDALIVSYYKMDSRGSTKLYGTDKSVTVAVSSQTESQVVQINGLDSGSKYGVTCSLRVRVEGKLFLTDPSEALIVATDLPDGDFTEISQEVSDYAAATTTQVNNLATRTSQVLDTVQAFTNRVTNDINAFTSSLEEVEAESDLVVRASEKLLAGLSRDSCIIKGVAYDGTSLGTYKASNIRTIYECLEHCRNSHSATTAVSYAIDNNVNRGQCRCFSNRRGSIFSRDNFMLSLNKYCWDITAASNDKWEQCTKVNKTHTGGVIATTEGNSNIKGCLHECAYRDDCLAVTYERTTGRCHLRRSGSIGGASNGADSVDMDCVAQH